MLKTLPQRTQREFYRILTIISPDRFEVGRNVLEGQSGTDIEGSDSKSSKIADDNDKDYSGSSVRDSDSVSGDRDSVSGDSDSDNSKRISSNSYSNSHTNSNSNTNIQQIDALKDKEKGVDSSKD